MKRYERVNLFGGDPKVLGRQVDVLNVKIKEVNDTRHAANKEFALSSGLVICSSYLQSYHFESLPDTDLPATVEFFIDNGINFCLDYFYGDWRNGFQRFHYETPCTSEESRLITQWNHEFYRGTLLCLLKNDIESLRRISKWIDRDIIHIGASNPFGGNSHATLFYYSPLFFVFAKYFCGINRTEYAPEIESIKNGKQSATKTLLKIWESICKQDTKDFDKLISQLVKKHIKANEKEIRHREIVSNEATWMWNMALRSGMTMPVLPEEIMDRIITPQSIGLEK